MKILIGFDVMLSYLLNQDDVEGIESVFKWIDRLGMKKYTDAGSLMLLTHFVPIAQLLRFRGFECITKQPSLFDYQKAMLPLLESSLRKDEKNWAKVLFMQLNQIIAGYADYLITDNTASHHLAEMSGIEERVYTVEDFLERCCFEHRDLDSNKGIAIQQVVFGKLDFMDSFFDTFKKDYDPYYEIWLKKKAKDNVYVAFERKRIRALLKLKTEGPEEDYSDIEPQFPPKGRLKISAFKVDYTGEKLGQRFLRIIFMQALEKRVDEIYVTIVNRSATRRRLINLLEYWGFKFYGIKEKREEVYVRSMKKATGDSPFFYYPYQSLHKPIFVIPLGYNYSHELLPDSNILNKVSDVEPYKAAIRKTIVFQNMPLKIEKGHNLLFYQINRLSLGKVIASGIVCGVKRNFPNKTSFIRYCSKRSILTLNMLTDLWERNQNLTVIDFLYNYSFEAKEITDETLQSTDIDISALKQNQVIEINSNQFAQIIKGSFYEENIITDKTPLC